MPYAEPTSPTSPLSPLGGARPKHARRHSHNSDDFRSTTSPMPGLPRRSTSSTVTTTMHLPRKHTLSNAPRTAATSAQLDALEAMRAVESLRSPPPKGPDYGVLGLKLHSRTPSDASAGRPAPPTPPVTHSTTSLLQRQKRISTSSLPSPTERPEPPSPVDSMRPSDRMVRKKSGEMVKPALKNRSLSTPDLSRGGAEDFSGKSKSSHNLRERTKSVRFDDGELESVVLFLRSQRPNAVAKAADGGYSPVDGDEEHETDLSDYVHFRTRRNGGARGADGTDQTEFQIDTCSAVPRVRLDFGPGTHGLLDDEYVVLERVEMCQPLGLRGSVLVRNIAFAKWVAVRFTLDDWQTVSEVSATHASHIPAGTTGDEGWDRFLFTIKLEDYRRKLADRSFHLCVRYNANGGEWWDSNAGQNYRVTFKQQTVRRQRPASQFWSGSLTHGTTTAETATLPRRHPHAGPRSWTFPRSAVPAAAAPARPESPALSPPPQGAFRPPSAPDPLSHLRLKKYCAPSPPQSPPKVLPRVTGLEPIVLPLVPGRARAAPPPPMTLVHGRPATTWIPTELTVDADDDVFTTSEESSEAGDHGDITPTAARARSPETQPMIDGASFVASPATSPVTARMEDTGRAKLQRNTSVSGDLSSLASVDSSVGLMTPPSSNLSSPPTPTTLLPLESPTTSMSTGDSSPANTLNSTTPDEIVDCEQRGRMLNAASYQEFIDKFCFFKSPPAAPMSLEDTYGGSYFPPITASGLYSGFNMGSTTPPGAMTPTYDRFGTARSTTPTNASVASASGSTPRASPARSPAANAYPHQWTPGEDAAPSVTAA